MKKYLAFILCIIMVFFLCACNNDDTSSQISEESSSSSTQESERGQGKLVINGNEVDATFTVYQTYAELPLIAVLEGLGYVISWQSDTQAFVAGLTSTYTLDLTNKTLVNESNGKNVIPLYGNSTYKCEAIEKDIIVDDVTLYEIMASIGHPVRLTLDYDTLTVEINNK